MSKVILKVVVDAKGRILAVAHLPAASPGAGPVATVRPILGPGMRELDISVPVAHAGRPLRDLRRALHVDAAGAVSYREET